MLKKQYPITRDEFIRIFSKIDEIIYEIYDYEDFDIKIWHYEDDVYILEKDTGILVNWYKHLGRCNTCNKELSTKEYEQFKKRVFYCLGGEE